MMNLDSRALCIHFVSKVNPISLKAFQWGPYAMLSQTLSKSVVGQIEMIFLHVLLLQVNIREDFQYPAGYTTVG